MTYRLLILACSQRKKAGPEYMPAIERYDGPLWQTLRTTELPDNLAVMFVSARYGLRVASTAIEDYNEKLTPELCALMYSPAAHTLEHCWRFKHHGAPVVELRDAAEAIRFRLDDKYCELFEDVCLVGGHLYLERMRRHLAQAQYREGCWTVDPRARVTEINASIGIMRQQLRAWICDTGRAILEPMA